MSEPRRTTGERVATSAPGKLILFGEHAVVYGRPAIAIPLDDIRAHATAEPGRPGTGVVIHATTLRRRYMLDAAPDNEPLAFTCRNLLDDVGISDPPDVRVTLRSEIPIASGLGSGAATAAAVARALARFLGVDLTPDALSALVYRTEMLHHGTPSGIDNTVVAHERPLWFVRERPIEPLVLGAPLALVVADTGVRSPTRETVAAVRESWRRAPEPFEALFDRVGAVAVEARDALARGQIERVGTLMNRNQELLREMGVSAPQNDRLVDAARAAGALGAKLSGGGGGGNNVALARPDNVARIEAALRDAGARRILHTTLAPNPADKNGRHSK